MTNRSLEKKLSMAQEMMKAIDIVLPIDKISGYWFSDLGTKRSTCHEHRMALYNVIKSEFPDDPKGFGLFKVFIESLYFSLKEGKVVNE